MPDVFKSASSKSTLPKRTLYKDLPSKVGNPLSAIVFCPENLKFETMDADEKIILFLRKHWITNLGWIIMVIILYFVPPFILGTSIFDSVPGNFKTMFALIWYLITTAYFLESFLTWYFNVYLVTDERIIDIDFYNLIYKEISDANLDKIQDATLKMGGVVRVLFNYGDVLIQTASEVPNFEFMAVPYPDRVVKILQELRVEEQQEAIEGRVR